VTTDTVHDNPARLRTYRVRLYWPTLKRYGFLRIDAIDAWDANALVRLNHSGAYPFGFEAWDDAKHDPEMREFLALDVLRTAPASPAAADSLLDRTDHANPEGPQG
jgi:hypothetical protein